MVLIWQAFRVRGSVLCLRGMAGGGLVGGGVGVEKTKNSGIKTDSATDRTRAVDKGNMNKGGHVNKGRRCIRTYHSRIFRGLKGLVYNKGMANSKITEKFARMKEGKVNCEFWLSAEAVKALIRMVELTGVTQASIVEMSLVAMLVGFTNNPYYEQLINQEETMREIRNRYPAQLSKFSFDELRRHQYGERTRWPRCVRPRSDSVRCPLRRHGIATHFPTAFLRNR